MFGDSTRRKSFLQLSLRLFCISIIYEIMWKGLGVWVTYGFFSLPSLYTTLVHLMIFVLISYIFGDWEKMFSVAFWSLFVLMTPYLLIDSASNYLGLDNLSRMSYRYEAYSFRKSADYYYETYPVDNVFGGYETEQEKIYKSPMILGDIYPIGELESLDYELALEKENEFVEKQSYIFWQSALVNGFRSAESTNVKAIDFLISPLAYLVDIINKVIPLFILFFILQLLVYERGYLNFLL